MKKDKITGNEAANSEDSRKILKFGLGSCKIGQKMTEYEQMGTEATEKAQMTRNWAGPRGTVWKFYGLGLRETENMRKMGLETGGMIENA